MEKQAEQKLPLAIKFGERKVNGFTETETVVDLEINIVTSRDC